MRSSLVLTVTAVDEPGLVDTLSTTLSRFDANWEESQMARLAGRFAGIVLVTLLADRVEGLLAALADLEERGLTVRASPGVEGQVQESTRRLTLDLVGNDREGIVREVSHTLAQRGVNVEELETRREPAPEGGDFIFRVYARLRAPAHLDVDALQAALEAIGNELMVDVTLASDAP